MMSEDTEEDTEQIEHLKHMLAREQSVRMSATRAVDDLKRAVEQAIEHLVGEKPEIESPKGNRMQAAYCVLIDALEDLKKHPFGVSRSRGVRLTIENEYVHSTDAYGETIVDALRWLAERGNVDLQELFAAADAGSNLNNKENKDD